MHRDEITLGPWLVNRDLPDGAFALEIPKGPFVDRSELGQQADGSLPGSRHGRADQALAAPGAAAPDRRTLRPAEGHGFQTISTCEDWRICSTTFSRISAAYIALTGSTKSAYCTSLPGLRSVTMIRW